MSRSSLLVTHLRWSSFCYILPDRVQRLKDARTEAAKEIEAYRKVKEQEFSAFQSSVSPV